MAKIAASDSNQPYPRQNYTVYPSLHPVTIFCDFDGPIVDVSDRYYNTYKLGLADVQAACHAQGSLPSLHILSKEQFWQMKQERTPDLEIALRSGLRGWQIELFLQRVSQIVNHSNLLYQDQLQPKVRWALNLLHDRGIRLVLVTLRRQTQAVQILRNFGLAHLFAQIRGTQDDEAAYLNHAHHKTQLLADVMTEYAWGDTLHSPFAWMVGDTEADILAGQAMGIPTIALTCGIRSQSYLQRFEPTQIYPDLFSAAHDLVESKQLAA
ncbi:MAG: HAD family hydrolase [Cyanobacteria bacterium CRU_2_1]|nr:HAD family hydrolase [Cyanobacteria bacterium RU_5_0]NJR59541.1 HAD family hydrolase [Cyanobacteria bacterium CRU_2_1]